MKKLFFFAALIGIANLGMAQQAANPAPAGNFAVFAWASNTHDFGKIKQGVPVTHEFKFTNTGKVPLVITNVQASCGCTTPAWTKDPVPPGGEGYIKATFNASAAGAFNKTVTVTANIESGFAQLTISGMVESPPQE